MARIAPTIVSLALAACTAAGPPSPPAMPTVPVTTVPVTPPPPAPEETTAGPATVEIAALPPETIPVTARRVPLGPGATPPERVGGLAFRGGLLLSSTDQRFGGLSGLLARADGAEVVLVSDRGYWLRLGLVHAGGRLTGVTGASLGRLRGTDGAPLTPPGSDAESLARLPGGDLLLGYERRHRIDRYAGGGGDPGPALESSAPEGIAGAPANSGLEAVTVLADGRILALAEGPRGGQGPSPGWLGQRRDGRLHWQPLTVMLESGYRPTGATTLADGDVLLVMRRFAVFAGFGWQVARIAAADLVPGARIEPRVLARFAPPLPVDNFEGIDAFTGPDGGTLVYVVSDDNFNGIQRSWLLMFALADE